MMLLAWKTRLTPEFATFSLARKRLPAFLIFASLASNYIGPAFSIGAADQGAKTGFHSYLLFLPFALQTALVGLFLAPRLAALEGCATIGDFMRQRYGRTTQLLTGLCSVGICIFFVAFLGSAAGRVLADAIGVPNWVGTIALTSLAVAYTFYGGLKAEVITDTVQFVVFTVILPLVALLAFRLVDAGTAIEHALQRTATTWQTTDWVTASGVALSFLLGETLIPPYANRALASKTPSGSRASFLLASLFCVVWLALVTTIGVVAAELRPSFAETGGALYGLSRTVLHGGVMGLMIVAILGILMTSQDSALNSGAVSFTRDLIQPLRALNDKDQLLYSRAATVGAGVLGVIVADWLPGIIEALLLIYSLWAPTVLVPLILGLLTKRGRESAAISALLAGGATSIAWKPLLHNPFSIPPIIAGVSIALIAYSLGALVPARSTDPTHGAN
jgi:SSS family solute:Na+ symporter